MNGPRTHVLANTANNMNTTLGYEYNFRKYTNTANMEITLAYSPEVNTSMSDRIKVAEYNAIYINFQKLVKAINKLK